MSLLIQLIDSDGGGTYDSGVTYSLTYSVHNPDGLIGPQTACNAVGWSYGNSYNNTVEHESDNRARCVSITSEGLAADDGQTRNVVVQFKQLTNEESEKTENPFSAYLPPSFKVNQEGELPVFRDANGQKVANRAGDPIADITEPSYSGLLTIRKNVSSIPVALLYYVGKVNGDSFQGFPPKTLKFVDLDEIQAEFHPTYGTYYPLTFYFAFNPDGHKKVALNEGYRALNDEGKIEHILINGEKTTEPMLLTEDGKLAPEGSAPVWLEFETAFALPFSGVLA